MLNKFRQIYTNLKSSMCMGCNKMFAYGAINGVSSLRCFPTIGKVS